VRTMNKRNLAAVLWFLAGWMAAGGLFALYGLPQSLGIVVGVATAGLVWWDPAHLIWKRPSEVRRVRPINEVAEELDRRIESWPAVESDSRRA
jgi:hypothetical protein